MNRQTGKVVSFDHEMSTADRARLEAAFSSKGDPYIVIRRKTKAIMEFLGCTEAEAEAIVLRRIDSIIKEA